MTRANSLKNYHIALVGAQKPVRDLIHLLGQSIREAGNQYAWHYEINFVYHCDNGSTRVMLRTEVLPGDDGDFSEAMQARLSHPEMDAVIIVHDLMSATLETDLDKLVVACEQLDLSSVVSIQLCAGSQLGVGEKVLEAKDETVSRLMVGFPIGNQFTVQRDAEQSIFCLDSFASKLDEKLSELQSGRMRRHAELWAERQAQWETSRVSPSFFERWGSDSEAEDYGAVVNPVTYSSGYIDTDEDDDIVVVAPNNSPT